MQIDDNLVDKLAELSKLEFDGAAKQEIKNDLNRILSFINKLEELDTNQVEPLIFMTDEHDVLREDEVAPMLDKKTALANAPQKDSDYFKVPKVLNK
jgi:aspartyl-tRNA(Asn)/glutamyl-tRNA(Gln) amidotransferase subunit C